LYSTEIYQYIPRQLVVVDIGSSPRRYDNVYAKTLKLHKGSDSRLQFQFVNQEQKPVNITGKEITFRLISYDTNKILLQQSLLNTLPLTGIAELRVHADSLSSIHVQKCYYSLELPDDIGFRVPGFMDKDSTGRGVIDVVNSVLPTRVPSKKLTIGDGDPQSIFYSEILTTQYNPNITIQVTYDNFAGSAIFQGSTTGTSDWYELESDDYADYPVTGSQGYRIVGYHPYVRLKFYWPSGNITNILAR
jgi:hypothetical protein